MATNQLTGTRVRGEKGTLKDVEVDGLVLGRCADKSQSEVNEYLPAGRESRHK